MSWRKRVFLSLVFVILLCEVLSLIFRRPHNVTLNAVFAVTFLFASGMILFDFTYKRHLRTALGVFTYGFTSVISIVLSEALTLISASYLYPNSFPQNWDSNVVAIGNALILITGYGYPKVTGPAFGVVVFLMLYSWLVNILLISKLITVLTKKIT